MSYFGWGEYVSVAEKRRRSEREVVKLKKQGRAIAPVVIEGRTIASSFWGKSWCGNLERYSDFASRLPRGRSYVRNGAVLDLQIAKGEVLAMVSGSDLYKIKITIAPAAKARWKSICRDCAGSIDSLVELLQGRMAKGVMDRVCREGDGLFPAPSEIKLSCSCPDWADMCKHVAATLYGVGARLDQRPQLLFVLRGVDESELLAGAAPDMALTKSAPGAAKVLDDTDMAALFGLDMAGSADAGTPVPAVAKPSRKLKAVKAVQPSTKKKKVPKNKRSRKVDTKPAKATAAAKSRTKRATTAVAKRS